MAAFSRPQMAGRSDTAPITGNLLVTAAPLG